MEAGSGLRAPTGFRGFNAAASLKPFLPGRHRLAFPLGFRGFNAAASLKLVDPVDVAPYLRDRLPRF